MLSEKTDFRLDKWQQDVLEHEGNICIRAGRQVGKSTVISIKAANFAATHSNTSTLIIAASQKQSSWLFDKVRAEIDTLEEVGNIKYAREPTRTKIELDNGSVIHCLPAGRTGWFIRGLSLDLLIADEAAFIAEEVWRSVIPMIAVSKQARGFGWIILLSTPFGKGGYFFDCFHDKDFRQFHVSSEHCNRIPKDFLLKEKRRMSKAEYAQEYLGEFIDEYNQFFPTALIKKCMTFLDWSYERDYKRERSYYLGVDIARYGKDDTALIIAEINNNNRIKICKAIEINGASLTDTVGRIKVLDQKFYFRKIFIDDAGLGAGVFDMLAEDSETKRKVVGLNNARRSIDREDRKKALLKEDLYSNSLVLMEMGNIEIISDLSLLKSLKNIVFEYTSEKNLKISGRYSHLAEAFVRACWCIKNKGLRVFLA